MSDFTAGPGIISPEYLSLLQRNARSSELGWDFYEGLVKDGSFLADLHRESSIAQRLQARAIVPRGTGTINISYVDNDNLPELPATNRFMKELGQALGSRVLSAQYNFYEPGSVLLAHNDGPNGEAEASAVLSVAGEGEFDIFPDPALGYTDSMHITVRAGDGVFLPPVTAREPNMFTSRRHGVANEANIRRVALVVAYIVPV